MRRLFLGITFILAMCLIPAAIAWAEFAGGTGAEEDPYLVATAEHLNNVRDHLDAHFLQTADIDLGVAPWSSGTGWTPIGTYEDDQYFTGSYDGGGYTISNLFINRAGDNSFTRNPILNYQGLFGYVRGAVVKNVNIENADIKVFREGGWPTHSIGILSGAAGGVIIENVSVSGSVAGDRDVGGLLGFFAGGNLMNVSVDVTVEGTNYTGGLVGSIGGVVELGGKSAIRYASVTGEVQGYHRVGGLVGGTSELWPLFTDSYSRASVSGADHVGGIIGVSYSGEFHRVYSTGLVSGTGDNVGGFVGSTGWGARTHDCYWDVESSNQQESAGTGVTGKTTAQMQQQDTYEHYNFRLVWTIDEGRGYPVFRDLSQYASQQAVDLADLDGSGTPEDPYIITTIHELAAMHHDLTASYRLANDLDLESTVIWNHGRGWNPVGRWQSGFSTFTGTFDGGGYTLRNLVINGRADQRGLFGSAEGAAIENVHLADADVRCGSDCAILAGRMWSNAIVDNISVAGQVISTGSRIGGLIGRTDGGYYTPRDSLTRVSSASTVKGVNEVGGLVGRIQDTNITLAFATGSVQGEQRVGGLIGDLGSTASTLADTYSRASVSGVERVGGLIGSATRGTISRSFSTGTVSGTGDNVGGFIGDPGHFPTFADNYWDTQTTGQSGAVGKDGVEGRTTDQMTYPYSSDTFVDWDFAAVWASDADYTQNDGYPWLSVRASAVEPPSFIQVPTSSDTGNYNIDWGSSSTSGVTYVLEEATNSSFTSDLRIAYNGSNLSASITNKTDGTYYYRVKATKEGYGDSEWRAGGNGCTVERGLTDMEKAGLIFAEAERLYPEWFFSGTGIRTSDRYEHLMIYQHYPERNIFLLTYDGVVYYHFLNRYHYWFTVEEWLKYLGY
ncbi:hypothetical protein [Desulfonatronovibrio magnus]|uniref:hypothetical protein n=1 Tax=Desulfonatronovibrio magnus TaxID=698827 RepID=UPI001E2C5086|nr:hypothetical protein [Desulfonatronovibrio magnus]